MGKQKQKKLPAGISEEFIAVLDGSGVDEKKSMIFQMQCQLEEADVFLKETQDLIDIRESLSQAEGPTRDAIKALKNRTKFVLKSLKDQGAI